MESAAINFWSLANKSNAMSKCGLGPGPVDLICFCTYWLMLVVTGK